MCLFDYARRSVVLLHSNSNEVCRSIDGLNKPLLFKLTICCVLNRMKKLGRTNFWSGRNNFELGKNDFELGRNDFELGRNDFEVGRNNLERNGPGACFSKLPVT